MEYQKLGKTNLSISRIGFGGAPIGGADYGITNDRQSISAIRAANKLGINFYDTADIYGFGRSERLLGEALNKTEKKRVVLATKVGVRWDYKEGRSYRDLSQNHILGAAENSLFNLRISRISLYQIHYPDQNIPPSETMKALKELQRMKKIKFIGCSNFTAGLIKKYQRFGRLESIQVPYNILDQRAERNIFPLCKKLRMGIFVYSPLAQGLLSGKYSGDVNFAANDRRGRGVYFTKRTLRRAIPLIAELRKLGRQYHKSPAQVAIRWILDNPSVGCILVGMKTPRQAKEAAGAFSWRLLPKEREKLTKMGKGIISWPD